MEMEVLAMERKPKKQVSDLPLLYIAQPDFKAVKHQMQQSFVIKKDVKTNENHIKQQVDETLATNEKETSIEHQEPAAIHKGAVKEQTEEAQESTMESQEEVIRGSAVEYQETEAVHQAVVEEQEQAEETQDSTIGAQGEPTAIHKDVVVIESEEETEALQGDAVKLEGHTEEQESTNEPEMNHGKPIKSKWQAISFREMNNEEKIDYLLNRPHYIPEVRCFIRTKQSSYIGYIKSYEDGMVKIKSPAKLTDIAVDIKDILLIQMIGT